MKKSVLWKLVAVIVAAVLVHSPAAYGCTLMGCVSPCISDALVYDYNFDEGCSYWVAGTGVTLDTSNGGTATIGGTAGVLYQEIVVGSYSSMALAIDIAGIYGSSGTERYRLIITNTSGTTLETVDVFWPDSGVSGRYDYDLSNYSNSTIRVRIGRIPGIDQGDTVMVVNWVQVWGRF